VTSLDEAAVARSLLSVPGDIAARIDPEPDGPGTLIVDLAPGVDDTALGTAVSRLLRERFGLGVAVQRIEPVDATGQQGPTQYDNDPMAAVLQLRPAPLSKAADSAPVPDWPASATSSPGLNPGAALPSAPKPGPRPKLGRLGLTQAGLGISAVVDLTWPGDVAVGPHRTVGEADGPATTDGVRRAVATATARCLTAELSPGVRVDLDDFTIATLGQRKVAVVRVIWSSAEGIVALTGASDVRDDVRQALVRAVLAATNRKVSRPV